ncbi:MAG TPA: type II secretion system protein [Thermoleophilia bacterium]|nr:type II secretion system protein [Thermoleophilia bacterium]
MKRQHLRGDEGLSLVELLITVVLAGIIFAAMVPFFYNALKTTSRDARRNDAQLIAQDRLEQSRLVAYGDLTQANLTSGTKTDGSALGDGRFGTTYNLAGQSPYTVNYTVEHIVDTDADATDTDYERVTITVYTPDHSSHATLSTLVKNPAPGIVSVDSGGGGADLPTTNLSITVSFKNWADVDHSQTSRGVYFTRTNADGTGAITSSHLYPVSASNPTVVFTNLTGGKTYTYSVTCYSVNNGKMTSPSFHLLKSARLKFDTNPGGS